MHRRAVGILALSCLLLACAAIKPTNLGDDDLSALVCVLFIAAPAVSLTSACSPHHHPTAFISHQLAESTHRAERAPAPKLDMCVKLPRVTPSLLFYDSHAYSIRDDSDDVDDSSAGSDFANAEE
jgi:hypothetical protein